MNNKKRLISVVIPVYNSEKYLNDCIDSVLAQTFENFEIILVDDGSTDCSGKVCDAYAVRDKRVRVIHKANGGLSDARNCGVNYSTGDYIVFVDSDDYISADYLEQLWSTKVKTGADITVVGMKMVSEKEKKWKQNEAMENHHYSTVVLDREKSIVSMFYEKPFGVSAWGKLYPRYAVFRYPFPVGELFEDLFTTYKILGESNSVAYFSKPCYFYVQRDASIMHKSHMEQAHWIALEHANAMLDEFKAKGDKQVVSAFKARYAMLSMNCMNCLIDGSVESKKAFKKIQSIIKNNKLEELFIDPNVTFKFKIKLLSVYLGYTSMRSSWKFIDWIHNLQ